MTGRMPAEGINQVEFPALLYDLWTWFLDLHASRNVGMGTSPITHLDLHAYSQLHRIRLEQWQLSAIRRLDSIALKSANESTKK